METSASERNQRWFKSRGAQLGVVAVLVGILVALLYLLARERPGISTPQEAMRETAAPALGDDQQFKGLLDAIDAEMPVLRRPSEQKPLRFGPVTIARSEYAARLQELAEFIRASGKSEDILRYISQHFRFFEVYGDKGWGEIFITGYFEPVIPGDYTETALHPRALYKKPDDLLTIELSKFDPGYTSDRPRRARVDRGAVVPYFTRSEIDSGGALKGRELELCWVDPVDAYFLQVQGSGTISFPDGHELKLRYAEKNGQPFTPVGRYLKEKLLPAPASYESIVRYLKSMAADERQKALDFDPSYVFFAKSEQNALTSIGVPATAGRTIATDRRYFPPGGLAFIQFNTPGEKPQPVSRFVLDQDVGGAIKGPGRVDLFFGRGTDAGKAAGSMQQRGRLYYLVPR